MKKIISIVMLCPTFIFYVYGQESNKISKQDSIKIYQGGYSYDVPLFSHEFKADKPRNIILMIGDGMGVSQVFAGLTANRGHLFLENFKHIGFSKTASADSYITDSAAGATALSTGEKTYNTAIGMMVNTNGDTVAVKTVLEIAEERGLSTGLISTSSITHATPASFIAHQPGRSMYEAIAADFLNTEIDVFIGGGYNHFARRTDGRDLIDELRKREYHVVQDLDRIEEIKSGKLAGLTAPEHNGRSGERNDLLSRSARTALHILNQNSKGFFLMIEGSQIDWGSHAGNTIYTVEEMLDFDRVIGQVLEFAEKDGQTLVIVTADHETGGLSITGGNMETGMVKGKYAGYDHTAVMVPIFTYGPGAEMFTGIMENSDIGKRLKKLVEDIK